MRKGSGAWGTPFHPSRPRHQVSHLCTCFCSAVEKKNLEEEARKEDRKNEIFLMGHPSSHGMEHTTIWDCCCSKNMCAAVSWWISWFLPCPWTLSIYYIYFFIRNLSSVSQKCAFRAFTMQHDSRFICLFAYKEATNGKHFFTFFSFSTFFFCFSSNFSTCFFRHSQHTSWMQFFCFLKNQFTASSIYLHGTSHDSLPYTLSRRKIKSQKSICMYRLISITLCEITMEYTLMYVHRHTFRVSSNKNCSRSFLLLLENGFFFFFRLTLNMLKIVTFIKFYCCLQICLIWWSLDWKILVLIGTG